MNSMLYWHNNSDDGTDDDDNEDNKGDTSGPADEPNPILDPLS